VIPAAGSLPIVQSLKDYPFEWTQSQINGLPFQRLNPPYWDEYVTLQPPVTYIVRGTHFCLPESPGDCIQYPAFVWAWSGWSPSRASADVRACYYATTIPGTGGGPGWRMVSYDDGGERCKPLHGWMNVTLTIPAGTYTLALYAYDKESKPDGDPLARYSQEYRIYDQTGTTLLASKQISGTNFDNGVYEIFDIVAPTGGLTIIVQVYNDSGHYAHGIPLTQTINVALSGIFVNKLSSNTGPSSVAWSGEDTASKGDWVSGGYGTYAHILPNAPVIATQIPLGEFTNVEFSNPVGGLVMPTNKLEVLAPYLALAGLIAAIPTVVAVRKRSA